MFSILIIRTIIILLSIVAIFLASILSKKKLL